MAEKDAMVNKYKVDAERIETGGKGDTVAVVGNITKEGKTQNRRV